MVLSPELRTELLRAGERPKQALLDRFKALGSSVIPALIEIATDESLHMAEEEVPGSGKESPLVWAPIHAIRLLGELRAVEAVEPLLPFFAWDDDDWLEQALPEAFGLIGAPALPAMERLLRDREKTIWTRARAAAALAEIGRQHPELRGEAAAILAARLAREEDVPRKSAEAEDEDTFHAFVISRLLDLDATEAAAAIQAAFDRDRVDRMVLNEDDVARAFGLAPPLTFELPAWVRGGQGFSGRTRAVTKVGRNQPCPCGSGKKYKKCCGA